MAMLVITRGYTSIFLWFSYGFPMVFLWFYYIPTFWTMLSPYEFHASPIRWSPRLLVSSKSLRMKTFLPRATKWTHAKHLSMDWYGDYIGFLWISGNIMRLYGMIMGWSWDDHGETNHSSRFNGMVWVKILTGSRGFSYDIFSLHDSKDLSTQTVSYISDQIPIESLHWVVQLSRMNPV
jgi:hypothetical protein